MTGHHIHSFNGDPEGTAENSHSDSALPRVGGPSALSQLKVRVVATLARAWETIRNRVDAHGLATVATRQLSRDKALARSASEGWVSGPSVALWFPSVYRLARASTVQRHCLIMEISHWRPESPHRRCSP